MPSGLLPPRVVFTEIGVKIIIFGPRNFLKELIDSFKSTGDLRGIHVGMTLCNVVPRWG